MEFSLRRIAARTVLALAAGGFGLIWARAVGLPLWPITGPALTVSLLVLAGAPLQIAVPVRDAAFLLVGIGIGTGMDAEAQAAMMRWPVAFAALAVMLIAILVAGRAVLRRGFGFDRKGALLAASPGHLSFVIAMSTALHGDAARVTVIQTIRVLLLTVAVPFGLALSGVEVAGGVPVPARVMGWVPMTGLIAVGLVLGPVLRRLRVPAHYLIGGMAVSALGHLIGWTPGAVHPMLALAGFAVIGTLIGTRLAGITLGQLRASAAAAMGVTLVAAVLAVGFAVPMAWLLDMPVAHVLVAFAPGGLETMIAMGAMLGADPGFVAACHLMRLLILPVLLPVMLGRVSQGG